MIDLKYIFKGQNYILTFTMEVQEDAMEVQEEVIHYDKNQPQFLMLK